MLLASYGVAAHGAVIVAASGVGQPTQAVLAAVVSAFVLVVPGYLFAAVSAQAGRDPDAFEKAYAARLAFDSVLVHAFFLPWTGFLAIRILQHGISAYTWQVYGWVLGTCLLGPVVLGRCAAWLARRPRDTRTGRFAEGLGIAAHHRFATAWSAVFGGADLGVYVAVELRDGRSVYGFFGGRSYASSDPERGDLYLQTTHELQGKELLPAQPGDGGVWINGADISAVRFLTRPAHDVPGVGRRRRKQMTSPFPKRNDASEEKDEARVSEQEQQNISQPPASATARDDGKSEPGGSPRPPARVGGAGPVRAHPGKPHAEASEQAVPIAGGGSSSGGAAAPTQAAAKANGNAESGPASGTAAPKEGMA